MSYSDLAHLEQLSIKQSVFNPKDQTVWAYVNTAVENKANHGWSLH